MNYIVLDIEATDQKPNEMVELAAVKLNDRLQIIDQFQSFIRPTNHPTLQWYIKKLTGIQQTQIDEAKSFPEVFDTFTRWAEEDSIFITWSNSDLYFLRSEFTIHSIKTTIQQRFVNIQKAVSSKLNCESVLNLKHALELLHFDFEGRPHRAFDDAYNTSKLFIYAMQTCGSIEEIQKQQLPNQNKYNFNTQIDLTDSPKINIRRYRTYIDTLSVDEMEQKLTRFEEIMTRERDKEGNLTSLYKTVWQKRKVLRGILLYQQKMISFKKAGLSEKQMVDLLKCANILYPIRLKLLIKANDEARSTLKALQGTIEESRKNARQMNKNGYLSITKEQVWQEFYTVHTIYETVLQSPYLNKKHKDILVYGLNKAKGYLVLQPNETR